MHADSLAQKSVNQKSSSGDKENIPPECMPPVTVQPSHAGTSKSSETSAYYVPPLASHLAPHTLRVQVPPMMQLYAYMLMLPFYPPTPVHPSNYVPTLSNMMPPYPPTEIPYSSPDWMPLHPYQLVLKASQGVKRGNEDSIGPVGRSEKHQWHQW
jgi:hypothetical protein